MTNQRLSKSLGSSQISNNFFNNFTFSFQKQPPGRFSQISVLFFPGTTFFGIFEETLSVRWTATIFSESFICSSNRCHFSRNPLIKHIRLSRRPCTIEQIGILPGRYPYWTDISAIGPGGCAFVYSSLH